MKRTRLLAALPALLLLVAATRSPLTAPRSHGPVAFQNGTLNGTYLYTAQGSDNVEEAIKAGTARMNFITRPVARSRLRKTNVPYQWVRIEGTAAQFSIEMDQHKPIVTPADGKTIKWKREDGELLDVNTVWEQGGRLKQTFVAGDGSRENLFWLSPDGHTLNMQVTIRSPRLPAPIVYRQEYRRKA